MPCEADGFWVSGYMTLQTIVSQYLANQYHNVEAKIFKVDSFVQRFPKSPKYGDNDNPTIVSARWTLFRFIG